MKAVFLERQAKFEKVKGNVDAYIERLEDIVPRIYAVKQEERLTRYYKIWIEV